MPEHELERGYTHVVATLGSAGDLHPFLAVARALREQGHAVLMLTHEPFRTEVEAQGVAFAPIVSRHDHERTARHPLLWHPIKGFGVLWRHVAVPAIEPTLATLQALMHPLPPGQRLTVLASPLVIGARLAQERWPERIRLTTGHTAPAGFRSNQDPMFIGGHRLPTWTPGFVRQSLWRWLDRQKLEPMAAPVLARWRQSLGLPALREPIFARWWHSSEQVLGFFPPDFGPMPSDWPVQPLLTGFPLYETSLAHPSTDAELTTFCHPNPARPLVVIYPGSAPTQQTEKLIGLAQHLAEKGVKSLLLGTHSTLDKQVRATPDLLQRSWVCLPAVLQHAALFVHHGGIGACAQGAAAGVRQWALPSAYDQFDNAWRLSQTQAQPDARKNSAYLATLVQEEIGQSHHPVASGTPLDYSLPNAPNKAVQQILRCLAN